MRLIPVGRGKTCGAAGPFKLKPWKAIVGDTDHGWSPLLWVVYLGFFFIDPILSHASLRIWLLDVLGAVMFLVLYLGLFVLENPRAVLHICGMMLLGIVYQRINGGACTFFIYAAAMLPFCVETQTAAFLGLGIIGAIGAGEGLLLHLSYPALFYSALFPMIIGAGNTFFAERERIARDLHDVLGHTLSVIAEIRTGRQTHRSRS